jgi:hypothetical protein
MAVRGLTSSLVSDFIVCWSKRERNSWRIGAYYFSKSEKPDNVIPL